jgi:glycosyltransferase involved in cell wall biosynthesis
MYVNNSMVPLVSIIITSYNYGRFLSDAIDSALNQTYHNTEVIVVDDGSTDNSREIIASYGDRIISVLKDNGGQASAFNAGFGVSKGDIIIFLDSDDKLVPDAAEETVKVWHPGISKVHYRLQSIDARGNRLNAYVPPAGYALPSGSLRSRILRQGVYRTPPTSGNAFGRYFLKAVFPIPEAEWHLCPDAYLHAQCPFYGEIAAIDTHLGYYRVHGLNASAAIRSKSQTERLAEEIEFRKKCEILITETAKRMNLRASFDATTIIARKIALFIVCPDHHIIKEINLLKLAFRGLRAIWRESDISIWKQITISAYFISVPFIPRNLVKNMSLWYIYPEKRPSLIKRLV